MIKRLIAGLALLLVAFTASAQTDRPLTNKEYWGITGRPLTNTSAGGVASCELFVSSYYPTWRLDPLMKTVPSPTAGPYTQHLCRTQTPNGSGGWNPNYAYTATISTCPATTPYWDQKARQCSTMEPPPPCQPVGASVGSRTVTTGWATGAQEGSAIAKRIIPDGGYTVAVFCEGMCQIMPNGPMDSCRVSQTPENGYHRLTCTGDFKQTGSNCTAGPETGSPSADNPTPPSASMPPPPPTEPNTSKGGCPTGSVPAGQDSSGMTICVGTTKPPETPSTTTEKPPVTTTDPNTGATTTVNESTKTNSDGSSTTTKTTTVKGADGTTSTTSESITTNKPDGSKGTQDRPEDKSDLCKQNPHLTVCRNSQVIGVCGEVTCTGDAIQCATLRAAAAMECKARKEVEELEGSSVYALGKAAASGADPDSAGLPSPSKASTVALPSSLNGSGWLGTGAAFADKTFTLQGHTITIPFSKAVGYLEILRYALMIVALLVSFRILSGAIIRE